MKIKRTIHILTVAFMLFGMFMAAGPALAEDPPPPEGGGGGEGSILIVKKTAIGDWTAGWKWTIDKVGDQTELLLSPGQTFLVNYSVTVTPTPLSTPTWTVTGVINFQNKSGAAVGIESVEDVLSDGTVATVTCPDVPGTLPAGDLMSCTYTASGTGLLPVSNTATIYLTGHVFGGTDIVPVALGTSTGVDECVNVVDDKYGDLGTVCAGDGPKTFNYSMYVGPYDVCGKYQVVNTATFTTDDTGTTGSDSWTVNIEVPCAGGCSLTPGYWKTHSEFGPAPYDNTWASLSPLGASTRFYLSGMNYYQVLWTPPSGGNAYYILAHAFIAAKLNGLNGANTSAVTAALAWAENFFSSKTPTTSLTKTQRGMALTYATQLDMYNNGLIGPGHCSE